MREWAMAGISSKVPFSSGIGTGIQRPMPDTRIRYRSPATKRHRTRYVSNRLLFLTAIILDYLSETGEIPTIDDVRERVEMSDSFADNLETSLCNADYPMIVSYIKNNINRDIDNWPRMP